MSNLQTTASSHRLRTYEWARYEVEVEIDIGCTSTSAGSYCRNYIPGDERRIRYCTADFSSSPVHGIVGSNAVCERRGALHKTADWLPPPSTTLYNTPSSGRIVSQPVTYRGPCAHSVRDVIKVDDGVKTTQPI